jgi:hypothetical protein
MHDGTDVSMQSASGFIDPHMDVSMPSVPGSIGSHVADVSMLSASASAYSNFSLSADKHSAIVTHSEMGELRAEIQSLRVRLENRMGGLESTMRLILDEARRARGESEPKRQRGRERYMM